MMSLATAITETMRAHELTTAQLAKRLGMEYDRATLYLSWLPKVSVRWK